jgi:hypothetical protein
MRLLGWYAASMAKRPFATNVATASTVMLGGDGLAQHFEHRAAQQQCSPSGSGGGVAEEPPPAPFALDAVRVAKMLCWTVAAYVPINYAAFATIQRLLPDPPLPAGGGLRARLTLGTARRVFGKAVLASSPTMVINPIFFAYSSTVEGCVAAHGAAGGSFLQPDWAAVRATTWRRYEEDLLPVVLTAYKGWVPLNCLNFFFLPPQFRIVTVAVAATVWNAYLSLVTHQPPPPQELLPHPAAKTAGDAAG